MSATCYGPSTFTPEAFTEAVLETLRGATWPDGSPLIEVDEQILRREIVNKIRTSAYAFAATAAILPGSVFGGAR
ncbi:hypothetical protein [Nocardioides limicola]|uniref:hypothetical protein n=1 Tax=Nocardioides limicola TaxID=2803368 RepID=UPI00193B91FC|nr:hypothetical protein [Nocardioides sp. DJM-14]